MIFVLVLAFLFSIAATSYFPNVSYFHPGRVIRLFQSGTEEIRKEISKHDTLTAYRPGESCEYVEVGRIEVVSSSGRYYLLGKVVSGDLTTGDIVKKGQIACIVVASDGACLK